MYYLDSNVIVSYLFETEDHHNRVVEFLKEIASKNELYVSSFSLIETLNAVCRKVVGDKQLEFFKPLRSLLRNYLDQIKNPVDKCRFISSFIINFVKTNLSIEVADDADIYTFEFLDDTTLPRLFKLSCELVPKLRIPIKDLLHVAYAYLLSSRYKIKYFLTLDREHFTRDVSDIISRELGLTVVTI